MWEAKYHVINGVGFISIIAIILIVKFKKIAALNIVKKCCAPK